MMYPLKAKNLLQTAQMATAQHASKERQVQARDKTLPLLHQRRQIGFDLGTTQQCMTESPEQIDPTIGDTFQQVSPMKHGIVHGKDEVQRARRQQYVIGGKQQALADDHAYLLRLT
ncbi:hypothetical protein D3C76_1381900 [compost metagenome]